MPGGRLQGGSVVGDYRYVNYETPPEGQVAPIMLNRPEAGHAQNRGLLVELDQAFMATEADDALRMVILGGGGPLFSSGHDMGTVCAGGLMLRGV